MTDEAKPKKPRGRPRLYPGTEKRPTLTFRLRGGVHEQLEAAALENDRSLSEEVERRVEESFVLGEAKALLDKSQIAKDLAWILDDDKIRQQIGEIAYLLHRVYEHSDRIYGENIRWFENEKIHYAAKTFSEEAYRLIRSIGTVAMLEDARLHSSEAHQSVPAVEGGSEV